MTSTFDYADTARRAESAITTTLDTLKNGVSVITDQFPSFPNIGIFPRLEVTEVVERQFALLHQVVDLNHAYARKLAEVADTLTGATRDQIESVTSVMRDQVQGVSEVARAGVDTVERTVREQADQAEQVERQAAEEAEAAEREQAREAAKVERQQRKEAHEKAREPYRALTKTELSEEAGKRDLAKSGTVEELIERLVEDDAK